MATLGAGAGSSMLEGIEEEKDGEDEGAGDGKAAVVEGKVQIAAAE